MSKSTRSKVSADSVSTENEPEKTKVAAACTSCGEIYAAEQWPDGKIRPIGRKDGCQCGVESFEPIGTERTA